MRARCINHVPFPFHCDNPDCQVHGPHEEDDEDARRIPGPDDVPLFDTPDPERQTS